MRFLLLAALVAAPACITVDKDRPPEGQEVGDCDDDADNDGDGLFDCDDDGCEGSDDCAEEGSDSAMGD